MLEFAKRSQATASLPNAMSIHDLEPIAYPIGQLCTMRYATISKCFLHKCDHLGARKQLLDLMLDLHGQTLGQAGSFVQPLDMGKGQR
jgi:hypothetical protein